MDFLFGCTSLKKPKKVKHEVFKSSEITVASNQKVLNDNVKIDLYDTIPDPKGYKLGYVKDPEMVNFLRPYFVSNICEPGNYNHPMSAFVGVVTN